MSSENREELIDIDYDIISAFNESQLERSKENIVFLLKEIIILKISISFTNWINLMLIIKSLNL